MNVAIVAEAAAASMNMRAAAQRFTYMLMDARAAFAMRMLAAGANFWAGGGGGGMTVALSGSLVNLSKREAGQIAALTGMKAAAEPQRLCPGCITAALRDQMLRERNFECSDFSLRAQPHPRVRELEEVA